MDQSKALHKLLEAADLVGMVEDLTEPSRLDSLSPASWTGMRLTLRTIREAVLASHNTLAKDLVTRSRATSSIQQSAQTPPQQTATPAQPARSQSIAARAAGQRGDLKTTMERLVE